MVSTDGLSLLTPSNSVKALKETQSMMTTRNKSSAVAEMGDRLGTIEMGRKVGALLCPFAWGEAGFPSNTMSPGPRPASVPSGILIHPTVWNVTDRQTGQMGQRSDSTGRTVLQTVAQKSYIGSLPFLIYQKAPEGRDATPFMIAKQHAVFHRLRKTLDKKPGQRSTDLSHD